MYEDKYMTDPWWEGMEIYWIESPDLEECPNCGAIVEVLVAVDDGDERLVKERCPNDCYSIVTG